ncbi:prephenate dehydrogenase [Desulfohalobiaceae bacterium Ax17]|uniref:prephenate dehydrogenase n=1 Tax=Desulfovulcanus ferrireducens TaxID=2831190 RepID=UPI00207BB18E|nr:prephenate dehydrogenase [Desulfovulcanus ferrireducens]MBT8762617.1 prephenate dehydrogenase [Desulfovulcanus ferrireducens]
MSSPLKNVTIIGGHGQMGRLLTRKFRDVGVEVNSLDKPLSEDSLASCIPEADVVFLAVPITALDDVLQSLKMFLSPPTILADICSVKVIPMTKMEESYAGPVVGTHPLFGPEPAVDDPLKVALCPSSRKDGEALKAVQELFSRGGMYTFITSAQEHDEAMAYIQGLNFITSLSYFACLPKDLDMDKFITPSFKRRMDAAKKMLTQDHALFAKLFEQNPFSGKSVRRFKSFLGLCAAGDVELLTQKALWWWRASSDKGGP